MKKRFSVLVVSIAIIGLTLSLSGVLVSQAAPVEKSQGPNKEVFKPVPARNINVVKKVFLSEEMGQAKGKPSSPSGKEKESGTATGDLGEPLAEGANKYAVVIGICDYPGTDYDICWSDGDSVNMYNALVNIYGYAPDNIWLLKDMGATYNAIYTAVQEMESKESSGDEVVFFFSGHGGRTDDTSGDEADGNDEVLIVHDGSDIVGILDDTLRLWFSDFDTTRIAFVFDTCLAGGQNDVAADGRVVSMATGENQSAYVLSTGDSTTGELGEGVFSHYFINKGMLQGKADKYDHDGDGNSSEPADVVVEEAFDYAKANIPPYLKARQKPVIDDRFSDDLLL